MKTLHLGLAMALAAGGGLPPPPPNWDPAHQRRGRSGGAPRPDWQAVKRELRKLPTSVTSVTIREPQDADLVESGRILEILQLLNVRKRYRQGRASLGEARYAEALILGALQ